MYTGHKCMLNWSTAAKIWHKLTSELTSTATSLHHIQCNNKGFTFQFHAHFKTLFKTACRALLAGCNCYRTWGSTKTYIILAVLNSPFEESFTTLTREDTIMETRNLIPTYGTWAESKHITHLLCKIVNCSTQLAKETKQSNEKNTWNT